MGEVLIVPCKIGNYLFIYVPLKPCYLFIYQGPEIKITFIVVILLKFCMVEDLSLYQNYIEFNVR